MLFLGIQPNRARWTEISIIHDNLSFSVETVYSNPELQFVHVSVIVKKEKAIPRWLGRDDPAAMTRPRWLGRDAVVDFSVGKSPSVAVSLAE